MKKLTTAVAALALMGAATTASAQEKVAISDLSWTGAKAIAHILQAVINGPLGSEAEIINGLSQQGIVAEGMDKGDGSADVYTDMWMPNQQAVWDKYIEGAESVDHNTPYKGTQSMFVPSYMADVVSSFDDLQNPEVAAMFDTDGNGKGEYWAGDAGWKSTKMWQVKFKSYGLGPLWEPNIVSQETFKATLASNIASEEPLLFYYWTPEAIHGLYELTALEEEGRSEGCEVMNLDAEDWLETSEFGCKNEDATIYVSFSKSLYDRNPKAAAFLKNVEFDPAEINKWIVDISENKMDPQDVAEAWVEANMDTVNKWIGM